MVNGHSQPSTALIDESSSLLMDDDSPSRPPAAPPVAASGIDELNGLLMEDGLFGGGAPTAAPVSGPAGGWAWTTCWVLVRWPCPRWLRRRVPVAAWGLTTC